MARMMDRRPPRGATFALNFLCVCGCNRFRALTGGIRYVSQLRFQCTECGQRFPRKERKIEDVDAIADATWGFVGAPPRLPYLVS